MRDRLLVIAFAIATGMVSLAAVGHGLAGVQLGPDVSGRWIRQTGDVPAGRGRNAGWGPSIEIEQIGNELTVRSPGQLPARYKADGSEVAETLSKGPCYQQSRVTKAVATARSFTITTWLVTRTSCFHGELRVLPDDPEAAANLANRPAGVTKVLETVTTLARVGDELTVDTTTDTKSKGSSTSTYRRR